MRLMYALIKMRPFVADGRLEGLWSGPPELRFFSEHARSFEQIRIAVAGLEAVQKPSPRLAIP